MPDGTNDFESYREFPSAPDRSPANGRSAKLAWVTRLSREPLAPLRRLTLRRSETALPSLEDELISFLKRSPAQAFADGLDEASARARAREDAGRHHPAAESVNPLDSGYCGSVMATGSAAAHESVQIYERLRDRVVREAQRPLRDLRPAAQNRVNRARVEIGATETLWKARVVEQHKRGKVAEAELEGWRREQSPRLDRLEPLKADWRWTVAAIAGGFLAETWGNTATLTDAVDTGWVGALKISLGIAAISMASGLAIGAWFGRLRGHVKPWVRQVGWMGSLGAGVIVAVLLFGLAAARDETLVAKATFDDAAQNAGIWAIRHPVSILLDLKSDVLWLVGMATWLWAYFEGIRAFVDPYFGFSSRWNGVLAIVARGDETHEEFIDRAAAIVAEARDALEVMAAEARNHADRARQTASQYERLIYLLAAAHGVIYQGIHRALRWYADENRHCRGEVPAPSWFGRTLDLSFEWPKNSPDALDAAVGEAQARAEAVYAAVTVALDDLERAHRESLNRVSEARKAILGSPAAAPESPLPPPTGSQKRGGF